MALGGSVLLGVAGAASASDAQSLQAEVAALKAEVAQLKGQQQDSWLNERRAEEVKSLVREVLADADTRASLLEGGMTAGHNGKNFFLASEDGSFLLNVGGQIQIRYIWNNKDDDNGTVTNDDDNEAGFQLRRTKLDFNGHIGSPKIGYQIILSADRNSNTVVAEEVVASYDLTDTLELAGGRFKIPFLREELVSSKRQLAVERSLVNEVFTLNRGEGVRLTWEAMENLVVAASLTDGAQSGEGGTGDFQNDATDFAASVRVDLALAGSLKQGADFSAWSGEETSIILGGALYWEEGETGTTPANALKEGWGWTVDASLEVAGFNLFGAIINTQENPTPGDTLDHWGYQVQAGYMVIPDKLEPFVRYEHIDLDNAGADEVDLLTFGANYYLNKHSAKFTLDLVWALDTLDATNTSTALGSGLSSGLGLLDDDGDEDDQIALRAQFQLLF
jgi:predicted porin